MASSSGWEITSPESGLDSATLCRVMLCLGMHHASSPLTPGGQNPTACPMGQRHIGFSGGSQFVVVSVSCMQVLRARGGVVSS